MPSKKYVLKLSPEERDILAKVITEPRAPGWKILRARALLKCDQGPQGPAWSDSRIAEAFECTVNSLENCAAVCVKCHAFKTRNHDIPKAAKTVRQQDKARGTKKPQRRPMPGSKASGLEKRMDGSVERRISLWPAGNNRDGD